MAEIRNLTRNGETFYPLTHVEGVLDPEGEYIGNYVENPEFVYVKTDAEGKILWAIKVDGGIYYGAGVPPQIIDYINDKIADFSPDEYEDIVAFLNELEKGDKTLQDLLNEKVNKEDGKSLIDAEYAEGVHYIENPEFIEAKVDTDDKVLEGIQKDGTKVIGEDLKVLGNMEVSGVSYKVVKSPEYLAAWIDAEDKIIFGFKTDGKTYVGDADFLANFNDKNIDWDALTSITATENPKFLEVELDTDDKVLSGRKVDGTKFENNDVELNGNATVGGSLKVDGVVIKNSEDPEGRTEILTDAEGRVLRYRKKDGTLVENVGIEANHLELTKQGMTDFQQALKDAGLVAIKNDYSNDSFVHIPKPKFAFVNLICDQLPTSKTVEYKGYFEYSDTYGNYFKKSIKKLSGQGRSSMNFPKKNYGFDFADKSKIKFGDWVEQDSFHLKANYIDCFRGARLIIGYNVTRQAMETYSFADAKPWRRYSANNTTAFNSTGKIADDLSGEALGVPDGFPFKLYHNGIYVGLYTLQLKKHRDNYQMGKSKAKNIHIDGENYNNSLFNGDANIIWEDFEVRNPKDLIDIDGNEYDGDNPKELSDTDALSSEVKGYIKNFSRRASNVSTTADFEDVLDVDYSIDCVLLMNFLMNCDVLTNNTQWCTWNGILWFPMVYDTDQLFGLWWQGYKIRDAEHTLPDDCILGVNYQTGTPLDKLFTLYKSRMDARYKELVDANILTVENVVSQLKDWCNNIGKNEYEAEFKLWPETPSYRDGSKTYSEYPTSGGFYDSIERVEKYMTVRKQFLDTYFNY